MKVRVYLIWSFLVASLMMSAQDYHFSQFYAAPLTLNPALTGNFNGLYRISGIYRFQWPGLTTSGPAFSTPSIGVDFSLFRQKLKNSAFGVGVMFLNDQQNGKTFNTNYILGSVAYNMMFGAHKEFQLGVGIQGGVIMTKADIGSLHFDEGYDKNFNYTAANAGESLAGAKTKGQINAGIFAKYEFKPGMRVYAGYALSNATQYKQDYLLNSSTYNTPIRHTLHGGFEFDMSDKMVFIPGFMFQHTHVDNAETDFGLTVGFHVVKSPDPAKRTTFFVGLWNRINTGNYTLIPKVGLEWKNFRAGIAYDAALAKQRADGSNIGAPYAQAFELTLAFIGDIKVLKEDHYLFNPRY